MKKKLCNYSVMNEGQVTWTCVINVFIINYLLMLYHKGNYMIEGLKVFKVPYSDKIINGAHLKYFYMNYKEY